ESGSAPGRILVVPPLLRPGGLEPAATGPGDFLLAYALNPGYGRLLAAWQRGRPEVPVRCYVEGGAAALGDLPGPGFVARPLDQASFLADLAACRAYVGTAGFEGVCEAFLLGKPTLAV